MNQYLIPIIKSELRRNQRLIKKLDPETAISLDGYLEKRRVGKRTRYYLTTRRDGKRRRESIPEGAPLIKDFVRQETRRVELEILRDNADALERLLLSLRDDSREAVHAQLPAALRDFPRVSYLDERLEELKEWAAEPYPRNPAEFSEAQVFASDGTRVRSKGECLWYNSMVEAGIPFRYDCALTLLDENGNEVTVYPDFLIRCYDGTLIIVEHLGMLSSERYAWRQVEKLRLYLRNGFVVGDNLILTSDTANHGTNSEMILRKVREIEQLFYRTA